VIVEVALGCHAPAHRHNRKEVSNVPQGRGEVVCDGARMPSRRATPSTTPPNKVHTVRTTGGDALRLRW
jgi:gentisate 1,2-dioxygenase